MKGFLIFKLCSEVANSSLTMAPANLSRNNKKPKEKSDIVSNSTKAKNDTKRLTNRKKWSIEIATETDTGEYYLYYIKQSIHCLKLFELKGNIEFIFQNHDIFRFWKR